jgi:hypothetical protein
MRYCLLPAACCLLLAGPVAAFHPRSEPEHTAERAGYPQCLAPWAVPGRTDKYAIGYVGGGCLGRRGEPWRPGEGIFGWDFAGCARYPGRVFLNWCHCGTEPKSGPYKTDGPHVPDVFSVHPVQRAAEKHRAE